MNRTYSSQIGFGAAFVLSASLVWANLTTEPVERAAAIALGILSFVTVIVAFSCMPIEKSRQSRDR